MVVEDRVIELKEAPQTARNHEAFTQVLVEGRSTEVTQRLHLQDAVRQLYLAACCRNRIASLIRLVAGR